MPVYLLALLVTFGAHATQVRNMGGQKPYVEFNRIHTFQTTKAHGVYESP